MTRSALTLLFACVSVLAGGIARPVLAQTHQADFHLLTASYALKEADDGWMIHRASGLGTRADPIRLRGVINRISPVRLELTAIRPINPFQRPETHATGTLHFALELLNGSGLPWIGMEFELQEIYGEPSIYGDGLSFDQRGVGDLTAGSDSFADVRTDFEPYDRVLFQDGGVNASATVRFELLVTDLTPAPVFYLKIDPRIPAS